MIALMLATVSVVAAQPKLEPVSKALLEKLAEHDERMEKYLDTHKIHGHSVGHERNGSGEVTKTTVTEFEQERKAGQLHTTVQSATLDGKDDLADEKDRTAKRDKDNRRTESPFAVRNQPKYVFTQVGQEGAVMHIAFGPKDSPDKEIFNGEAWVDTETGEVTRLKLTPSKNPAFVDRIDMNLDYTAHGENGRLLSSFSMSGAGGVLMFKKSGDLLLTFTYP